MIPLPPWLTVPNLPLNLGTITAIGYSAFYMLLEPVAGTILFPLIMTWTAFANHLTTTYSPTANYAAIAVEVISWVAQFVGHGVFEGRAPALLDNLVQALVLAPFFVFMELMFMLGYRPELRARVEKNVEKELARLKAQKALKNGKAQ